LNTRLKKEAIPVTPPHPALVLWGGRVAGAELVDPISQKLHQRHALIPRADRA
jgi:hypothetical protein